ncbi:MAG: hypothetical protein WKF34_12355 [Pyrinomonadaceae bacterium]
MKQILFGSLVLCVAILLSSTPGRAQDRGVLHSVAAGSSKVAVVVVSSAAKSVWVVTKFSARHIARPVARAVLLRAPEYVLRTAGYSLRKGIPAAGKIGLIYLKTKLP